MPLAFKILGLLPDTGTRGVPTPPQPLAFVSIQSGGINITDIVKDLTLSNVPIVASTSEHRLQLLLIARENVYSGSNSTAIQDVTRGGISMTFLAAIGTTVPISCGLPDACARMEVWYILNPDVGSEDVVVTTLGTGGGGGSGLIASAWQFNGVNQIAPFGAVVSAASQTEQHSLNVSSNIGEIVVAWIHGRHNHDLTEPGGGQTNRYTELHHGPASTDRHAESKGATKAGASTVNVRWDNVGTNQDEAVTVGFGIKPA